MVRDKLWVSSAFPTNMVIHFTRHVFQIHSIPDFVFKMIRKFEGRRGDVDDKAKTFSYKRNKFWGSNVQTIVINTVLNT